MTSQNTSRQFDAREEGKGNVATGNERKTPTHDVADSTTDGSVSGLHAPKPLPDGFDDEGPSAMTPTGSDSGTSDGVAELKKMEENAEDGRG